MTAKQNNYRPEVDGLRAFAVLSVITYHAEFTANQNKIIEGGFIGVDIFFVISGYLITRIILAELADTGDFDLPAFYNRRVRRIIPALTAVILASLPFAWHLLLPVDLIEFSKSILSAVFFGSNIFFYFSATDYGADASLLKPFLHTWSLGVEEQFYLVFPLILYALHKYLVKFTYAFLLALFLSSLLFSQYMASVNSDFNFYLPFSRFWQLSAGSLVAYYELKKSIPNQGRNQAYLPSLGILLIVSSIFLFNPNTPHPSLYTLLPIIGVSLIIAFSSQRDIAGRLLGSKPLVGIGLISYSLYLWHFPIFAFGRISMESPTNTDKLLWLAVTFSLSIASYYTIEKPFRSKRRVSNQSLALTLGSGSILAICICGLVIVKNGVPERFTALQQELVSGFNTREYRALEHPASIPGVKFLTGEPTEGCSFRSPKTACKHGNQKLVFLGDSYAGMYQRGVIDALSGYDLGFISLTYEQCPFTSSDLWFSKVAECPLFNEERSRIITEFEDEKIFIVTANDTLLDRPKERTNDPMRDGKRKYTGGTFTDPKNAWNSYFMNIEKIAKAGHKVVVIRSVPRPGIDGRKWLGANTRLIAGMNFPNIANNENAQQLQQRDQIRYPSSIHQNAVYVDPVTVFCETKGDTYGACYDVIESVGPLYNGGRHLSYGGAYLVGKEIERVLLERGWLRKLFKFGSE